MPETIRCSECGAELPTGTPKGLCSRCALLGALEMSNGESQILQTEDNANASPARSATPIGQLPTSRYFGDYELLQEIARGGMGVVYKARQQSLNRVVAVKMLLFGANAGADFIKRFRVEASAAAALQHPNIVAIHEVGVREGEHFLVMDFVEGSNLARLAKEQTLPPKRAAQYLKTIAEAIHYAHEHGILHRDLKPSNVLIDANDQPRVTDFGLAKVLTTDSQLSTDHAHLTQTGHILGSPGYMPPEQAGGGRGKVSRRSDVYSLGAMLYHLLTGRPPFGGGSISETLKQVETQEPVSLRLLNPGVPLDLETICLKCLEKDPGRRYQTSMELSEELGRFLKGETIHARPVGRTEKLWRWGRRNPLATALILVLCTGFSACLVLLHAVSEQKRAHQTSLNTLIKTIGARVQDLTIASRPFEHFSAEEVKILLGRDAAPPGVSARFTVATFIDMTPMQTLITFGKLINRIEKSVPSTKAGAVRLDLRIYNDYAQLREDLASGVVHFASVDGPTCLAAQSLNPAVRALVCDQRPGLPTVIFVRADSGITNLAGLKGHSLAIPDKGLNPFVFVFSQLLEAGLCARDVHCSMLAEAEATAGERRIAIRKSQEGSYGQRNSAQRTILEERSLDAGVAFAWQLRHDAKGIQWRHLITFRTPDFLWVAGSKVDALARDAFTRALLRFRNPQELESVLVDTDTDGFAYTTATDKYLESIRAAERARTRFQKCLPPPNSDTPPGQTPNKN
jgi:predicted Ser/Thr protein kinase